MKITKKILEKIIREEIKAVIESRLPSYKPEDQPMMSRDLSTDPVTEEEIANMSYEQVEDLIQANNCDAGGRASKDRNLGTSCRLLTRRAFKENPARS